MIDIIYDIFNQLVDLYQQFFGVPEGVTYALFGSRKKKKAKKKLKKAEQQIGAVDLGGGVDTSAIDSIPNDFNSDFETTELVTDTGVIPGTDIPEIPYVPSFPYTGQQIILNSGRLHLNAKDDFIILNSKKSISLAAPGSINIDTEGAFIVNAQKIRLGIGDQANHPLVYGDKLYEMFVTMARLFQNVAEAIEDAEDTLGGKSAEDKIASQNLKQIVKIILTNTPEILSKQNFTQ